MKKAIENFLKCPNGCWQNCEHGTECLAKARGSQPNDLNDWVNDKIEILIPYLKRIITAIPTCGTITIKIIYVGDFLERIYFNGVEEYIPDPRECVSKWARHNREMSSLSDKVEDADTLLTGVVK